MMDKSKVCSKCKRELPLTTEHFYFEKKGKGGFRSICKNCMNSIDRQYRETHREAIKENKHLYYEENREIILEQQKSYLQGNRDSIVQYRRFYYEKNKERLLRGNAQYRKDNRAAVNERSRQWSSRNGERKRIACRKRRTLKHSMGYKFNPSDWQTCLNYFHGCCAYCGAQQDFWHVLEMEHFIPLSHPDCPGTIPSNIVPACRSCNASKRNNDPYKWLILMFGKLKGRIIAEKIHSYFVVVQATNRT